MFIDGIHTNPGLITMKPRGLDAAGGLSGLVNQLQSRSKPMGGTPNPDPSVTQPANSPKR
jgi:hypothetical protein